MGTICAAVADEEHSAVSIVVKTQGVGGIDAPPFQFPRFLVADISEDCADARADVFLPERLFLALAFPELVVHAPDIVRLLVDQHRAARIAARFEECTALGRKIVIHADIRDHVFAFIILAFQPQAQHRADRRARAIRGEHVVGVETIVAGGRGNAERDTVCAALDADEFALPAHVDQIAGRNRVMQELLDILLLKIVHRQVFFAGRIRHLQPEDLLAAVVAAAEAPAQRLFDEGRDRSNPLQNMHARPREADGAATIIERVLAIDEHASNSVPCQNQRSRHADRAGADNHDRVPYRDAIELGDMSRRKIRIVEIERIERPFAGGSHAFPFLFSLQPDRCLTLTHGEALQTNSQPNFPATPAKSGDGLRGPGNAGDRGDDAIDRRVATASGPRTEQKSRLYGGCLEVGSKRGEPV